MEYVLPNNPEMKISFKNIYTWSFDMFLIKWNLDRLRYKSKSKKPLESRGHFNKVKSIKQRPKKANNLKIVVYWEHDTLVFSCGQTKISRHYIRTQE